LSNLDIVDHLVAIIKKYVTVISAVAKNIFNKKKRHEKRGVLKNGALSYIKNGSWLAMDVR